MQKKLQKTNEAIHLHNTHLFTTLYCLISNVHYKINIIVIIYFKSKHNAILITYNQNYLKLRYNTRYNLLINFSVTK